MVDIATDKINNLLESFMGINDAELGRQLIRLRIDVHIYIYIGIYSSIDT